MTKKALKDANGYAVNIIDANKLAESFTPDIAALFEDVPDDVEVGWRETDGEWAAPVLPEPGPPPAPVVEPRLLAVALAILRLPFEKLVGIRMSQDPGVETWLYVINMLVNIDLNDPHTTDGLDYLVSKGLISADDKAAFLA